MCYSLEASSLLVNIRLGQYLPIEWTLSGVLVLGQSPPLHSNIRLGHIPTHRVRRNESYSTGVVYIHSCEYQTWLEATEWVALSAPLRKYRKYLTRPESTCRVQHSNVLESGSLILTRKYQTRSVHTHRVGTVKCTSTRLVSHIALKYQTRLYPNPKSEAQ